MRSVRRWRPPLACLFGCRHGSACLEHYVECPLVLALGGAFMGGPPGRLLFRATEPMEPEEGTALGAAVRWLPLPSDGLSGLRLASDGIDRASVKPM